MMTPYTYPKTGDTVYRMKHASGLDILVWPQPTACSAYATFVTRYGSVYNTQPTPDGGIEEVPPGIAHYLEHKLFESEDGDAFVRFSATGAAANAYTAFDRTAYLFQATENILPSLDILLDFVRHPYFTDETVKKEQGIIGQEIRMCEDEPEEQVLFKMLEGMYHRHPVRIDIGGTVESIAAITPELLYRCYERYYDLHNMVLIVAGKITPEEVEDAADRLLLPAPPQPPVVFSIDEPLSVVTHRVEKTMPVASPLFSLGFKEPPAPQTAERIAGAQFILELIVGKSTGFYAHLLEERLINDEFGAEYFSGPGYGVWLFGGESADPDRVAQEIRNEILRLQREGPDAAAIERIRRAVYGRTVSQMDNAAHNAEFLLGSVIDGIEPFSELDALASLTVAQIHEQLCRRVPADEYTLSVISPLTGE